ncbi:glutamyl-tRNA reductase [Motilimonas cestriensis]|uniref:Glutamyl-tRNA reductase n=1 Tax=Motilimonas cestriensis TaxID=2742685 RepID=A0ABS8W5J6_9GAMM|nr:glutamyl-tRNA reductase [Motilimonas cestriensis]MCE2593565.1 glutamyl-tRNA reductase [Motilimonas cestriensis]
MTLFALGINHKTASVALREKLAFAPDAMASAHQQALTIEPLHELVIVSTCNRTELYGHIESGHEEQLLDWLCQFHHIDKAELRPYLYIYKQEQAIAHLIRVSSGLDSLVLGEPQILGQIKQAYGVSREVGAVFRILDKLFQHTFAVAKQIRSQTDIGANAVSVAYAAVNLSKQIFSELSDTKVLLIGAGETIELAAKHLVEQNVAKMFVANRTIERAELLSEQFGAKAITLGDIPQYLPQADIVISSTAAPLPILGKGAVETALKQRKHQPMLLVDIAVPRDIESEVAELNDAYLYTVDDLQGIIEQNMEARQKAAVDAERIVTARSKEFMAWLASLQSVNHIREYRQRSEQTRDLCVSQALAKLQQGGDVEAVIRELGFKLTNKLIHQPTVSLTEMARKGQQDKLETLCHSLGLSTHQD